MIEKITKSPAFGVFNSSLAHHLYFWIFFFIYHIVEVMSVGMTEKMIFYRAIFMIGIKIPPVYAHFWVFGRYFSKRKYVPYFLSLIIIIAMAVFGSRYLSGELFHYKMRYVGLVLGNFFLISFATALRILKHEVKQRLLIQEIEAKQVRIELDLLRYQVNPHFLFNTLNNLFSMANTAGDSKTADGIAKLAHLMRYMLYESNGRMIPLQKEIDQINSFIELERLRFDSDSDLKIDFQVTGDIQNTEIPPMLLIPFIENGFKHSFSFRKSSFVKIALSVVNSELRFFVENSVNSYNRSGQSDDRGVGLQNIKRRLELLYGPEHTLEITGNDDRFAVGLTIKIT